MSDDNKMVEMTSKPSRTFIHGRREEIDGVEFLVTLTLDEHGKLLEKRMVRNEKIGDPTHRSAT